MFYSVKHQVSVRKIVFPITTLHGALIFYVFPILGKQERESINCNNPEKSVLMFPGI